MAENNDNVRSLPLDNADLLRHGIEAFRQYVETLKPAAPDVRAAEIALFDQIVMCQLNFQCTADAAIETALVIIKARRALSTLAADA